MRAPIREYVAPPNFSLIYTDVTKKAMKIAFNAHRGQTDRAGIDCVNRPLHLAEQMETESETCAALLHDVVEDSDWTIEMLAAEDIPNDALEEIRLLPHREGIPYMEHVESLKDNKIARKVKLANLAHNSDLSRLPEVSEKDCARIRKYNKAIELLNS